MKNLILIIIMSLFLINCSDKNSPSISQEKNVCLPDTNFQMEILEVNKSIDEYALFDNAEFYTQNSWSYCADIYEFTSFEKNTCNQYKIAVDCGNKTIKDITKVSF